MASVPDIPDDDNVVIGEVGKKPMTTVGGEKGVNTTMLICLYFWLKFQLWLLL